MGCDIHYLVEGRRADSGKWEWASFDRAAGGYEENTQQLYSVFNQYFSNRNYSLFWLLAGVRYWQEGGDEPMPLFHGRGIPADACAEVSGDPDEYLGDHSRTFIGASDFSAMSVKSKRLINNIDPVFMAGALRILYFPLAFKYRDGRQFYSEFRLLIGFDS